MRTGICLALVLCVAAGSGADMLVDQTAIYDVFITPPVSVGSGAEQLLSTRLYAVNTTGNSDHNPSSFDGVFFGYEGVLGSLHQQDSPALSEYTPTADSAVFATAIDTHFLNVLTDLVIVEVPFETRNVSPSSEPSDALLLNEPLAETTFGDRLSGTFALLGGNASDTWELAQIVVSNGTTIGLDFAISGVEESGNDGLIQASFEVVPEQVTVVLDIKPGSDPNSVNLKSKGLLPVVVYGTEGLDLTEIDLETLLLNGVGPRLMADGSWHVSFEDVDGDLLLDLLMHFEMQALGIEPGMTDLALTGLLMDGTELQGADAIRIVPDFNGDLMVNATDLAIMKHSYGAAGVGFELGDANADGFVDATDLALLRLNLGWSESAFGEPMPEPASAVLFALAGLTATARRRRRKRQSIRQTASAGRPAGIKG